MANEAATANSLEGALGVTRPTCSGRLVACSAVCGLTRLSELGKEQGVINVTVSRSLLLLCSLFVGGCVWPHRQWDMANVSGRVVEASNGQALPDVVILSRPWGGREQVTQSDAQGRFSFSAQRNLHWLPFDRGIFVELEFSHPGYEPLILREGLGDISERFSKQTPAPRDLDDVPLVEAKQEKQPSARR